ncbi:hypothetical protein GGTG_03437 [Gaeumannomyces tritici R3-111a-1]|uniref:DNA damage-binding protein 1 n=1 Tax=Gaeumannomyces tritici (strain R3-111a-1) TaxID=644352 RepID=J3NQ80_GAET3|nr:hypothetical protein GGTG_03437 [Gaeumannomyces tritici R3-111a-1]EJT78336.1 hypothetical protein GGTG_03437 [Gaeumannomyces tritici R3-111a-1]
MAYIAPIHRASSVRHALQVRLLPEGEPCLVLAKSNRLEVWQVAGGHLTLTHSKTIHGTIVMLQALQPKDSPTEMILVGTDRFRYFSVLWNQETRELETVQDFLDHGEQFVRDVTTRHRCLVDPSGRFIVMLVWSGVINVMCLQRRKGKQRDLLLLDQSRISELYIKDAAFLYSEDAHPRVAFLYQTKPNVPESKLVAYRLCSDDKDLEVSRFDPLKDRIIDIDIPDPGAVMLIPVERVESKRHHFRNPGADARLGGLLVVGETQVLYIDDMTQATVETALMSPMVFVAWAKCDASHYILADDYGGLHLLTLDVKEDGVTVKDIIVCLIGKASRANELVCLDSGYLFVGSHYGDSELLCLNLVREDTDRPLVETVQTLPSIAPILDFTVMDMGNREADNTVGNEYASGQARIVTGSGAHRDGSLRSVRSGVRLDDIGILADMPGVRGLFPLESNGETNALVASFLTETRVFTFDAEGDIEEVEAFQGLDLSVRSLLVTNLGDDSILQITDHGASVIGPEAGITISSWEPPTGRVITGCSTNGKWLLLSIDGKTLVSLRIPDLTVSTQRESSPNDQISCLAASPHLPDIGAVGFWSDGSVSIINLCTLDVIHSETLRRTKDAAIVPRDIVLARVLPAEVAGPTLFVSMDDGEVVTFTLNDVGKLSARKSVVLGTRQARFHVLPQPGDVCNIFVTSEHSSLIYGSDKRIIYSAVTAESATYVCPFDTAVFPGSLAVATDSELKISKIDPQRQSHVQSLPMGENVRSIAYSAPTRVFGLGCIRREISKGVEKASSTFRLVDEVVLQPLGNPFELNEGEVVETVIRAQLRDTFGRLAERFIVGTRFLVDENLVPGSNSKGRVLVFGVDEERSPFQIVSHPLKSGCRRLAVMEEMIVVALTKTVVVARYEELTSTSGKLIKVASYQTTSYAIDVAVEGRLIAVGDIMKSMSLVEFVPPTTVAGDGKAGETKKPAQLIEVCRHYQSSWSTAVAHFEGESWLEADADGNVMVLGRNTTGVTLEDRRRMEITSEINLGENINRIQKISVETGPNAPIHPKAFLSTTEGSIYLVGAIAPQMRDLLLNLQDRLEDYVGTLGNIPFKNFRSFRNAEREADGPVRFIDGEYIERFLDMNEETQSQVCRDLGPSVEDMRNLVEELKNMH